MFKEFFFWLYLLVQAFYTAHLHAKHRALSCRDGGQIVCGAELDHKLQKLFDALHGLITVLFLTYAAAVPLNGFDLPGFWEQHFMLPFHKRYTLRVLGIIIDVLALLGLRWQHRALGHNWSVMGVRMHQTLVTSGPYRFVRHPWCVIMAAHTLGGCLLTASWPIPLLLLISTAACVLKAFGEEKFLEERFKEQYKSYQSRTGMFFPRL